jgi:amidase
MTMKDRNPLSLQWLSSRPQRNESHEKGLFSQGLEPLAGPLAALIKAGDVSSREVVDAHLARIEAVNPALNAITVMLRTSSREAADMRRKKMGKRDLPSLHGVPITVKENIDCIGTPTTFGLAANANALPEQDAPVVERPRR